MSTRPEMLRPALAEVLRLAVPHFVGSGGAGSGGAGSGGAGSGGGRLMVGITGPPAVGKSTLAVSLADTLARRHAMAAVAVPMDGFHLANVELERLGLAQRKGAPETFDVSGFVHLLRRLREADEEVVYAPSYSRTLHESIGGAVPVPRSTQVIVVEGNYLLHDDGDWRAVGPLLDLVLYLEAPDRSRQESLVRRQLARGLDEPAARDWVESSDEVNARLVAATRSRADVVLQRHT